MKGILGFCLLLLIAQISVGQDKKIDQLEILYDQAYYAKVIRKANKLLADPEYDYSALPAYYKALALFRLSDDENWSRRHRSAIADAIENYQVFAEHANYYDYVQAHYYELASLKTYLDKLGKKYKDLAKHDEAKLIVDFSITQLTSIKSKPDSHEIITGPELANNGEKASTNREKLVVYAKSLVGIKYVWAGSSEEGFDCSGFTSYVCKKYGFVLPRTASGQLEEAKKVKIEQTQKGDLVFFGSGEKITHVGLVVSNKGEELTMVHASTSKGVIVTNIEQSTYWKPKLKAAGTYFD